MQPHWLRLKGFRGIRDGLGRDELILAQHHKPAPVPVVTPAEPVPSELPAGE